MPLSFARRSQGNHAREGYDAPHPSLEHFTRWSNGDVEKLLAVSSVAVTVGLAISRPRLGRGFHVGPALAAAVGVAMMLASGFIAGRDLISTAEILWRPFATIASIMILAAAAQHLGVLDRLAAATYPLARNSTHRLFALVFSLSAVTAAVLNNDSAILLLTPLIVLLVRAVYPPGSPVVVPFVFAVFMAAGVAPLVVSNPMNMIVAEYAGIGFNEYALRMLPISIAGWIVSYLVLRAVFSRQLAEAEAIQEPVIAPPTWDRNQWLIVALSAAVVGSYPVVAYVGGPIWAVAATGAALAVAICAQATALDAVRMLRGGVSWETLGFLLGIFVLAIGLRNAGVIDWLADIYRSAGTVAIGTISAVGSAVINNHSMGLINVIAIEKAHGTAETSVLAALIGGDLGPRLLPVGSLAGLLWYASLHKLEIDVSVRQFVAVGVAVTVPSLAVSLLLLRLL